MLPAPRHCKIVHGDAHLGNVLFGEHREAIALVREVGHDRACNRFPRSAGRVIEAAAPCIKHEQAPMFRFCVPFCPTSFLLLALASSGLAGCGGDSSDNAGATGTAGTTAAAGSGGDSAMGSGGVGGGAGSGGSSAGSAGTTSSAGAPAVDCSIAGTVPITVAWNAVNSQPAEWFASAEALTVADNVIYYQNADGGWPKNIDMTLRTAPMDASTIDNHATTQQILLLAKVFSASGCSKYGDAALKGITYLLDAQYSNGGWPQYYPDPEGYHAHITYNDNAMVNVMLLLRSVSKHEAPYAFVDDATATAAAAAVEGGIQCMLDTQIIVDNTKTGWCAQHDEVTLEPAQARTYELPSISGSEGAGILSFLMTIDDPSPEVREAVNAAAAWFEEVKILGIRIDATVDANQPTGEDRVVVDDPSAPPIWARFYEIGTNKPIFSSRCEVPECDADPYYMMRYSLAEIDNERRVGYAWYGDWPADVIGAEYSAWLARWP